MGGGKGEALKYYLTNHEQYKSMHKLGDTIDVSDKLQKVLHSLSLHCITKEK